MNSEHSDKWIFASVNWLEQFRRELQLIAAENPDFAYSNCTVLTNVPPALNPDEGGRIAYVFQLKDGDASFELREVPDTQVDIKAVSDYESMLPLATMHYDLGSDSCMAKVQALHKSLLEEGYMVEFRNRELPEVFVPVGVELHNRVAAFTDDTTLR